MKIISSKVNLSRVCATVRVSSKSISLGARIVTYGLYAFTDSDGNGRFLLSAHDSTECFVTSLDEFGVASELFTLVCKEEVDTVTLFDVCEDHLSSKNTVTSRYCDSMA